ncbi:MAG: efflux RND transporter periplasmic adaptor subunit, partial [Terriglobia bacterium]
DDALVAYTQALTNYQAAQLRLKALKSGVHQAQIESAKAQLTSAQGAYLAAKAQLSYSEIRSPIDGVVASRPLYVGEMASTSSPLFIVMNASKVIVRLYLPPNEAALLRPGDSAVVSLGSEQVKVDGKVTIVSPALDPNSTTVQVWVEAPNPHNELKPGASANVSMIAETSPHSLVVPASAIINTPDQGPTVMLVGSDSRAHQTPVKTGIQEGDEIQILSGIHAGDTVITQGGFGLDDNTKVQVSAGS